MKYIIKVYTSNNDGFLFWNDEKGLVLKSYDATKFETKKAAERPIRHLNFLSSRKTKIVEVKN